MTDNQTHQYFQAFKNADSRGLPHRPLPASDFLSLSPIYFDNAQDLENKLKSYKQKSKNDKGRDVDNSTANAIYRLDLDSGDGKRRSDFELNRLGHDVALRFITQSLLTSTNPGSYTTYFKGAFSANDTDSGRTRHFPTDCAC